MIAWLGIGTVLIRVVRTGKAQTSVGLVGNRSAKQLAAWAKKSKACQAMEMKRSEKLWHGSAAKGRGIAWDVTLWHRSDEHGKKNSAEADEMGALWFYT